MGSKRRSRYDELHDKYSTIMSTKAGTRYERLAAVVFKVIDDSGAVIHDMDLIGNSDVPHQIDVHIETNGETKRILVECKDFDVSGSKVGLGIVRNFWGVIDDVHPDDSIIITCTGFTGSAIKYAKSKGIRLAVLRVFEEGDWEGRIRKIVFNITAVTASEPRVKFLFNSEDDVAAFQNILKKAGISTNKIWEDDSMYIITKAGKIGALKYFGDKRRYGVNTPAGNKAEKIREPGMSVGVEGFGSINVKGFDLEFEVYRGTETVVAGGDKLAELILKRGDGDDLIVWDKDLKQLNIDEKTGEVILKNS